ncbi:Glu/Leu/Phe/Val dehydrogenase dimerization domain-containing protein [Amycolatopsis sp. WQ 127309]|uniref:Glu/Leu/Phe/Val dehydrogenase dimerization domain-containing protein n=1 Tax=Amycolatopsis sp. WQ 127309 TaxID=2932773 RepID=UPI001FF1D1F8|nr:Glu/Leu/Phe/Val dehydrogenase dimerization domain-containing protein [Amycolatopsis sp. WQ 127309]UOZ10309.1 glutamate dehydrogenase [Amycolatopsis sp. WQ 127309]
MTEPAFLEVTWTDPGTGCRGYLVIDRLVRGVASGGLRMRRGCRLSEVRGLARGMTLKEGLNYDPAGRYVPLGGAKGGIDFDPYDERARDVVARYLRAMRPLIEQYWTLGEDLGLRQDVIDSVITEIGLQSSIQAIYPLLEDRGEAVERLAAAFKIEVGGLGLDELVGGLGVAQATLTGLEVLGLDGPNRVVVQGFGSMGGATARFLAEAGLDVVGVSDVHGVVTNPDGLDVENLLRHRDRFGGIDRDHLNPGDELRPPEAWLDVPAEVLVPAAVSYCVDAGNQGRIGAKLIVEAANMPVTAEAERLLGARGIRVVPDFVANSATNSWWWWTLFGDVEADADAAFAKVRTRMRELVTDTVERAARDGLGLRATALALSEKNFEAIQARFG